MGNLFGRGNEKYMSEDELLERRARRAKQIVIPPSKFKMFEPNEKIDGQGWAAMNTLTNGLLIDVSMVNQLFSLFCIADLDNSGSIDLLEMCYFLRVEDSPFNKKLFALFDMDGSGEIDFLEFSCSIWNICTWAEEELAKLMFFVYDQDYSGFLDLDECESMVEDVFALRRIKVEEALLKQSIKHIAVGGLYAHEKRVYQEAFVEWANFHIDILHPLKCMYILIRNRVLGVDYWDNIGKLARKSAINSLVSLIKGMLGKDGCKEAINDAMLRNDKALERELQKKQQEDSWGGSSIDSEFIDGNHKARVDEAKHRVRAVQFLHENRIKKYDEWYSILHRLEARRDPLSVLLRFTNRDMTRSLRKEFEEHWKGAMPELQDRVYDRISRLKKIKEGKKGKGEAYFRRKIPTYVGFEDNPDFYVQYSSASGKLTWAEQKRSERKKYKRALRDGGGNAHLGAMPQQTGNNSTTNSDSDQEESSEEEEDDSENEEEHEKRMKEQFDSPLLRALYRRYFKNWKPDVPELNVTRKSKSTAVAPGELLLSNSQVSFSSVLRFDDDEEELRKLEEQERAQIRLKAESRKKFLNQPFYKNMPSSSKKTVESGQYAQQNLKRPEQSWKDLQISRVRSQLAGKKVFSEDGKPLKPPRRRGRDRDEPDL